MNIYIKILVGVVLALGVVIGVSALAEKNKMPKEEASSPDNLNNLENTPEENFGEETGENKSSVMSETELEVEMRKDRGGDARGAQKGNKDASTLQNDLNNASNP